MSQNHRISNPPLHSADVEASIRQLIADGKSKTALDSAKDLHKAQCTAASEALLIDAYLARIESLTRQNLAVEAKALVQTVRERYPSARTRLDGLAALTSARSGTLDEILRQLGDPALTAERRAAIEKVVEEEVFDLSLIADCTALLPDDPLRRAASALRHAFAAVTSGPVAEEALALTEVSHRSPLAAWKLLVRAIACFYQHDDPACRQYLDRIKAGSAPARLVAVIRKMLGDDKAPLKGTPAELAASISGGETILRRSFEDLDQCFAAENQGRILSAIRTAVRECRMHAPGLIERLEQHISVRCAMIELDKDKVAAALGGPSHHDARFLRLFARGMEATQAFENLPVACGIWDQFRIAAVEEGWFTANGMEAAALYLHMAGLLRKIPAGMMQQLRQSLPSQSKARGEDFYYLQPETLYERACALDPHSEAFAQWLAWAKDSAAWEAERVAKAWHKILPRDIEPVLYLMERNEHKGAFHTALEYLAKAERIDSLHTHVRNARLRLLFGNAMRQICQKKTAIARETLDAIAVLPQAQRGDRPALVTVLRYMISAVAGDSSGTGVHRAEVERLLGSRAGASILITGVADGCKRKGLEKPPPAQKLSPAERAALPAALARAVSLAKDVQLKLQMPSSWVDETARQFPKSQSSLDIDQLRALGEAALLAGNARLAYAVSAAGLDRGRSSEAGFLLLRAEALPHYQFLRRAVCAAAAAEIARGHRHLSLVEEALEFLRNTLHTDGPPVTIEQASEVVQKEKAEPAFPKGAKSGPDYSVFARSESCPCPDCRRARGEFVDPYVDPDFDLDDDFDDDDDFIDDFDGLEIPPDMPPEVARMLYEETKKAVMRGESLPELVARLTGGGPPPRRNRKKKGKRK